MLSTGYVCATAVVIINIMCKIYACHVGYKIVVYVTDIQYCIQWK